jgi:hypothetical protein
MVVLLSAWSTRLVVMFTICARQIHHTSGVDRNLLHDSIGRYFGIRRSEVPRSRLSSHSTRYFGIPLVRPSTAKRIQFLPSPVIRSGFVACKFGNAAEKPLNGIATPADPVTIERRRLGSIYRITSSFTGPRAIIDRFCSAVRTTISFMATLRERPGCKIGVAAASWQPQTKLVAEASGFGALSRRVLTVY